MKTTRVLVLGAGYAGLLTSLRLARRAGNRAAVTLVDAREAFCERIRLHQVCTGQPIPSRSYEEWSRGTGVTFVKGRVLALNPTRREVQTEGATLPYDVLVMAIGSHVDANFPGAQEHARVLDGPGSAAKVLADLRGGAKLVTVVGGGLLSIEAATEIAESFPRARVRIVTLAPLGAGLLSEGSARHLRGCLKRLGVTVLEGVRIERFEHGRSLFVTGEIPHDLALLCAGFVGPELPKSAGLAVNAQGRMLVDEHLACLSHPEIRGAGDAAIPVAPVGAPMLMSCRIAQPMATYVADDIVREHEAKHRPPFRYRDVLRCISLSRSDGIVQFQKPDGALRNSALRGRAAAWVKERICRLTVHHIAYERLRARLSAIGANTPRLKEHAA